MSSLNISKNTGLTMDKGEIAGFFDLLVGDCIRAAELWEKHDDDYTRRSYVRAVFAFIDGNTYRMKQLCLLIYERGKVEYNDKEISDLVEKRRDGTPVKIGASANIKIAFKLSSRAFGVPNPLDTNGGDWLTLLDALKVRHRLMHPKSTDDFNLSYEDMMLIGKASEFYRESSMKLVQAASAI